MRRLSPALLTMVMLGVVGLLVVMYVGKKLLAREAPPLVDTNVSVPMSLTDLEPGTRITEANLATGPAARTKLTRDVVLTSRALVGRVVKNKILATEPIKSSDLYPPGVNAPLVLEPGMVAVTVPSTSPIPATRGQYVDIHFIPDSDPDLEDTGGRIMTLFKGVKILQIGSSSANRQNTDVTLELTREQANIILLAKDKGTLNFVYAPEGKGTGGVAVSDADRATLYEILGYTPTPPVPPTPPFVTELFEGTGRTIHSFQNGRMISRSYNLDDQNLPPPNSGDGNSGSSNPNGGRNNGSGNEAGGGNPEGPSAAGPRVNRFNR
ncbi:Flp pilus assembly protein CpaB [Planctomicrobium sp. SH661]|uniref:Flp pilus assembly protein CpaB n=1 Tax=Planctomicrobium sp. SH661 TaxID=3448124 RepID=UPI003F5C8697